MRKQCPACLSNRGTAPLHRRGLLMRGKDKRLSARSFLLTCSGNALQGSPSLTLTERPRRAPCTNVAAALWSGRSGSNLTPRCQGVYHWLSNSTVHCRRHCSQWMPHWEDLTLLTPLPLPVLFPWIPARELARRERRTWQIEERHDRKESSTGLLGPIQVWKCIISTLLSQSFRSLPK